MVAALIQAELVETLQGDGPFTVFAPTDQAFADAGIDLAAFDTPEGKDTLANILLYHVVAANVPSSAVTDCMTADAANSQPLAFTVGGSVMVNGATVTLADVSASNGVIHVIDKVLTPSDNPNNIPRTAQCTGVHTSLVAALIQAELVETLQGDGPFTVFAPTDQAFADAGIDLAALDTPEGKETLANILLYHVVSGEVASSALTDGMVAETVNGDEITFDLTSGVMVNDASVITADVAASNGIIHVIDKVLMPPTEDDSSDEAKSSSDDDDSSYTIWIVIGLIVIIGGAGAVLFMRSKDSEPLMEKDLSGLLGQLEPVEATAYATQTVQQQYPTQPAQVAQPAQVTQPVQMTQAVQQPVVAEPAVLKQWTDEAGYTWRKTDDGNTYWWTGAEWQKYG